MIIVTDSGATKADWRIIRDDGTEAGRILTPGMNVSSMAQGTIEAIIADAAERITGPDSGLPREALRGIYFYSAGVYTPEIRQWMTDALRAFSPTAEIEVDTDLVGSARAACGHAPGIAAILGTGSNSCFYDGREITRHVLSGGFIIGDEGSAATLGRLFVSDLIKGFVPEAVAKDFSAEFDSSYAGLVENIYRSKLSPAGYLGSMAPFLLRHYDDPYVKHLVDGNFQAFIDRCLLQYDVSRYPVGIIGGFGNACRHIFTPMAEKAGITVREYLPEPVLGLIRYHLA